MSEHRSKGVVAAVSLATVMSFLGGIVGHKIASSAEGSVAPGVSLGFDVGHSSGAEVDGLGRQLAIAILSQMPELDCRSGCDVGTMHKTQQVTGRPVYGYSVSPLGGRPGEHPTEVYLSASRYTPSVKMEEHSGATDMTAQDVRSVSLAMNFSSVNAFTVAGANKPITPEDYMRFVKDPKAKVEFVHVNEGDRFATLGISEEGQEGAAALRWGRLDQKDGRQQVYDSDSRYPASLGEFVVGAQIAFAEVAKVAADSR